MLKRSRRLRLLFLLVLFPSLTFLLALGTWQKLPSVHAASSVSTTSHWLYVVDDGSFSIYDIDNNNALVRQVSLPVTGKRGVGVSPSRGLLYVSYCGATDCGGGHGSLLAYDLIHNTVAWNVNYSFGVDQFAVTPDGSKIYMPKSPPFCRPTIHGRHSCYNVYAALA